MGCLRETLRGSAAGDANRPAEDSSPSGPPPDTTYKMVPFHESRHGEMNSETLEQQISQTSGRMPYVFRIVPVPRAELNEPQVASKSKRFRNAFSQTELGKLEAVFQERPYPNKLMRKEIAIELGRSLSQIKVWFKNRRFKSRKSVVNNKESSAAESKEQHSASLPRPVTPENVNHPKRIPDADHNSAASTSQPTGEIKNSSGCFPGTINLVQGACNAPTQAETFTSKNVITPGAVRSCGTKNTDAVSASNYISESCLSTQPTDEGMNQTAATSVTTESSTVKQLESRSSTPPRAMETETPCFSFALPESEEYGMFWTLSMDSDYEYVPYHLRGVATPYGTLTQSHCSGNSSPG